MSMIISPNMNLPVPTVGNQPGPLYAQDINAALTLVDSHDHTPGHGVPITPAGMNINTDLTFGGFAATNLRAAVFTPEASVTDLDAIYVNGVDFYLNDGNGNTIRLTQSGAIVGTPGSITGLPSGTAGVNFSGGVFTFSASTNTPANIQIGSVLLGNNTALSKYLTLAPPNAMASDYQITLPALPASTKILQMDSSGVITAALAVDNSSLQNSGTVLSIKNNGITNAMLQANVIAASNMQTNSVATAAIQNGAVTPVKQSAKNIVFSSPSGSFSTTNVNNATDVTNLIVTITTSGRPVMLLVTGDSVGSSFGATASVNASAEIRITDNSNNPLCDNEIQTNGTSIKVPASISCVLAPSAGTYTYKVRATATQTGGTCTVTNAVLIAYEL